MTFDVWKQAKLMNGYTKLQSVNLPETKDTTLQELKKLAGLPNMSPLGGMNMSVTGTEKGELMKKHNIQPGTPEWFKLWFSLPYMTGEKPVDK
jgi:hypothetical protein